MHRRLTLWLLLVSLASLSLNASAFQPPISSSRFASGSIPGSSCPVNGNTIMTRNKPHVPMALNAKGNKNKTPNNSDKQQQTNPVELILTYMTPWKNPNSIFVYLIGTVWLLGTIAEARGGPL